MNLARLLVRAARVFPDRPAVLLGDRPVLSYRALAERAARLAGHLRDRLGLAPGARVAVFMTNHTAYLEVLYAAWWAGLAVVPINAKLHPKEVEFIVGDAEASVLFVTADLAGDLQPLLGQLSSLRHVLTPGQADYEAALGAPAIELAHCAPDELAWLFYTSGTTGRPKGVMQTHRNLYAMTACYFIDVDEVSADDAIVYAAPMSHGAGLYNFAFVAKAARHVVPVSSGFDPAELMALSRSVGRLCMFAAPTMVRRLVEHVVASAAPVDGFKTLVYGGGPMYVEDIRNALATMGPRFVQIYGQGESPMTITALSRQHLQDRAHPRWAERIASVGVAQTLVEVRVVDEGGATVPAGQTGEVVVRGDPVMAGYWRNPEASAKALREGWLWTGDMGAMDGDGFLTLKDRSKDVVISGGSNIYPREVEEVLLRHPAVREVSVIGQPDPEWGEIVVAFVVGNVGEGLSAEALDALSLQHIARFKRPKRYVFVDGLPKNNYGKVLKTALREMLDNGDPPMLKGRTALVTGSTQGIGLAIAQALARAGADIVVHGIEPVEQGQGIAAELASLGAGRTAYVRANLADADEAAGLVAAATQALRAPDIVVNNAGIQHTCPIESFPAERWDAIIAINLSAAFHAMKAALPAMRERGWGRIVNIASVHGLVASVNKGAYLAAKHGLVGLSKGVALETAAEGITVNCICPGWTDTAIIQPQIKARAAQFGGDRTAAIRDLLREKQPNLTLLPPERIGDVAVFLCSDAAAGITGVALPVDGGWTAQ